MQIISSTCIDLTISWRFFFIDIRTIIIFLIINALYKSKQMFKTIFLLWRNHAILIQFFFSLIYFKLNFLDDILLDGTFSYINPWLLVAKIFNYLPFYGADRMSRVSCYDNQWGRFWFLLYPSMFNKNVMVALDVFVGDSFYSKVNFSIQRRKLSFTFLFVYSILCIQLRQTFMKRKIQQTEEI